MIPKEKSTHKEQSQSTRWCDRPFEEVGDIWLSRCREKLSALTCDKYEFWYERYVLPQLRGTLVKDILLEMIKQFPTVILNQEWEKGNPLKKSTLMQIGSIVSGVVQMAEEMERKETGGYLQKTKTGTSGAPEVTEAAEAVGAKTSVLTPSEQEALCVCAKYHHNYEMLASLLILYCGIGTGEVCALHCDDIDLERGEMYIHQTVQRVKRKNNEEMQSKTERIVMELPTKKQIRTVVIPEGLMEYINEFYKKGVYLIGGKKAVPFEIRTLQNRTGKLLKLYHLDVNFIRMHNTFVRGEASLEIFKRVFGIVGQREDTERNLDVEQVKTEMVLDLPALRLLVGMTIEEMSSYIGISAELYRQIEEGKMMLSWTQFLALLFLFQYNRKTKVILEPLGLLPNALEEKIKI